MPVRTKRTHSLISLLRRVVNRKESGKFTKRDKINSPVLLKMQRILIPKSRSNKKCSKLSKIKLKIC